MDTLLEGMRFVKNYELIFRAAKKNNREVFRELFFKLHIKDQEEVYQALYPENKEKIETFLNPNEFADLFERMQPRNQKEVYKVFSNHYIASLFTFMESDNIIKFLTYLEEYQVQELIALLDYELRKQIEELMNFEPETAGFIMNKSYMIASMEETVKDVAQRLRALAQSVEMVYYVYVLSDDGILEGIVSLRDLIIETEESYLADLMVTKVASVRTDTDQETAAHLLQEYDLVAVPVLDDDGKLKGIITVDDVMDVMSDEVTEDFNDFAAIGKSKNKDIGEESAWQIARVRVPWIIILIFLGMISASLISSFEDTLNEVVLLAAFIPIIMDSAGNVGTQSLAVAVRKISVGENPLGQMFWKTIYQEFLVGIIIGISAGVVLGLIVTLFYGNPVLGLVIGITLLLTLSLSNVVGAIIPVLINKLNIDPAVASGPFITTVNDAVGLLIYFSIATQLLQYI